MLKLPPLTIGIEEEYLLVDPKTRDLIDEAPPEMMRECEELCEGQVSPEFLRSQIEIGTRVCKTIKEAEQDLKRLRGAVITVADRYGYAPIASSTHPFGIWSQQKPTRKERYEILTRDMQAAARRLVICGMHIHIGIDDDELRIDLMNQMSYFLPHLLALSCSSPFWQGEATGLRTFRLTIFDALPRTRLPERFSSYGEYQRHVNILTRAGLIEDPTKIWWDLRPSARYPTLETRITDVCTRYQDAVSIAALAVSTMRMLARARNRNMRWRIYSRMLLYENRWRAMRYSFDQGLMDFSRAELVPFSELLDELIELVREDAEALDCVAELESCRDILDRGTSSHRQTAVYEAALADGSSKEEALRNVVDFLIEETRYGV